MLHQKGKITGAPKKFYFINIAKIQWCKCCVGIIKLKTIFVISILEWLKLMTVLLNVFVFFKANGGPENTRY